MATLENYKIIAQHITSETYNAFIEIIENDLRLSDRVYDYLRMLAINAVYSN